jgi:benzoylformate decarboxylase
VHRLADLPRIVHRAAKTALAPPTGPVFLSLPADILNAEAEIELSAPTRIAPRLRGDRDAVEAAAALLAQAERPLLIAGDAVAQSRAHAEMVELAELLGAPVFAESIANTASFPASHPLFRGGMVRLAASIRKRLEEHDVLFSVGGDLFTLSLPSWVEPVPKDLKIIHLDIDPWELGKNDPAQVAILGDPKATLPEITAAVRQKMTSGARRRSRERFEAAASAIAAAREQLKNEARAGSERVRIDATALLAAVGAMLPRDAVVIDETISSGRGIRELIRSEDEQSFFGLRGGGIGWGLPAAIGVKLALPDRPVVALIGDGSAMYTCQALWTAAHDRIGAIFVILNNTSYRILKQRVHALRGHAAQTDTYVGMELTNPAIDFLGLARALGIAAERARTIGETTDLLGKALAEGGPMLIEVMLDRAFKPM